MCDVERNKESLTQTRVLVESLRRVNYNAVYFIAHYDTN